MTNKPKTTKPKRPVGRPTIYSQELGNRFCEEIASGRSMRTICKAEDMPEPKTIFRWFREKEGFSQQYARACEERAEALVEEIFDISDDSSNDWMEDNYEKGKSPGWELNGENIQRARLRVDTRKWYMSKMKPKKYGDKLDLTSDGKPLPTPIYGGLSAKPKDVHIPGHDGDQKDIPA